METILKLIFGGEGQADGGSSSVVYWIGIVVGVLVVLVALRLIFVFSVGQRYSGFMLLGGKLVREKLVAGWYFRVPFVYEGIAVYLGLRTLEFEEETRSQDQALVVVKGALHYRVLPEHAALYHFGVENPDKVIEERVLSAMRSAVSSKPASESFEHKDAITSSVLDAVRESLLRDVGIEVVDVPITEVAPHKEVAAAFNAVQAAQRRRDEATALAEVKITEANGDAQAMRIRAQGQASQLGKQAEGLLEFISVLSGKAIVELPTEAAVFVMSHFLGVQMRTAFAEGGRATAMIIPDDRDILKELTQLLPTLIAHSGVEGPEDEETLIARLESKAGDDETTKEIIQKIKSGSKELTDEMIEKLPPFLRPLARRIAEKARRKAEYGGGA